MTWAEKKAIEVYGSDCNYHNREIVEIAIEETIRKCADIADNHPINGKEEILALLEEENIK